MVIILKQFEESEKLNLIRHWKKWIHHLTNVLNGVQIREGAFYPFSESNGSLFTD